MTDIPIFWKRCFLKYDNKTNVQSICRKLVNPIRRFYNFIKYNLKSTLLKITTSTLILCKWYVFSFVFIFLNLINIERRAVKILCFKYILIRRIVYFNVGVINVHKVTYLFIAQLNSWILFAQRIESKIIFFKTHYFGWLFLNDYYLSTRCWSVIFTFCMKTFVYFSTLNSFIILTKLLFSNGNTVIFRFKFYQRVFCIYKNKAQ